MSLELRANEKPSVAGFIPILPSLGKEHHRDPEESAQLQQCSVFFPSTPANVEEHCGARWLNDKALPTLFSTEESIKINKFSVFVKPGVPAAGTARGRLTHADLGELPNHKQHWGSQGREKAPYSSHQHRLQRCWGSVLKLVVNKGSQDLCSWLGQAHEGL